ncbi:UDP-N-acetylmuramoylalanine--D-glutamate ligase [Tenacibaculum litopenaei]|jgi:UDP-N-acetylmuramoylalanine--D-glutamate ligase|uniref:UDP-N-acetylmuramoyl-L-alanine--D-glutamate ligase n=1 Tax=Tenacibaculum litopenaei TaxID=396016 RepID=UPI003893CB1F
MKRLVVLGGGESGVGTAILGKQKGFEVFVSDRGEIVDKYKRVLQDLSVTFEEGRHTEEEILKADVVMKSPGIPDRVPLVQKIKEQGIPVVSEIEFASKYTDATIVGITGSNGKTTTSMLTHHVLKNAGFKVGLAGNIGDSFAKQVANEQVDNYVLELSSFQLDGIEEFSPHIAVITNITPDHLDRYEYKFENYIASKLRITENQTAADFLLYDADDEVLVRAVNSIETEATLVPFSLGEELEYGAFIKDNTIQLNLFAKEELMKVSELKLQGKHNTKNAMAAAMAARLLKARKASIAESLSGFEGVEHRLESVQRTNGVQFINDSKATNVNAAFYALECMDAPTIWIVGGVDKGNDYTDLLPLVREKVKAIVCLGIDNTKIIDTFENVVDELIETAGAEEAVKVAYKLAEKGDTVLLSPACASFDLFKSYEDRGTKFKNAVRNL